MKNRKYNKGITMIEVIISLLIISMVLSLLMTLLSQVRKEDTSSNIKSGFVILQSTFINQMNRDFIDYGVSEVSDCSSGSDSISTVVSNIAKGYNNPSKYLCVRFRYTNASKLAATKSNSINYMDEAIFGYFIIYNTYLSYVKADSGTYYSSDDETTYVVSYQKGFFKTSSSGTKKWQVITSSMRALPEQIMVDNSTETKANVSFAKVDTTYIARISLPIVSASGERYDIDLSTDSKSFKCNAGNKVLCYDKVS